MRVVVAMSGGVDSSTVAALLVEAGHEVIGLAMKTHDQSPKGSRACCTPDDMRDARRVADMLDIPFYVLNYADLFSETVIAPFAEAYLAGRTPNPCVVCNDQVKFAPMLERARLLGAQALATGHYARISTLADGRYRLLRGVDANKDQSYFLYRLRQEQLSELMFPLGGMTKEVVRAHARRLGLPTAEKSESQEICFVGAEGYAKTVESITGTAGRPGDIVDADGVVLGQHQGVHHFTLGQRRGLQVAAPTPLYVTHIDAANARVHVGRKEALLADDVTLEDVVLDVAHIGVGDLVHVQQRYRDCGRAARVVHHDPLERKLSLQFLQPEPRGAPGQAAVMFVDDGVVGGGTIAGTPASPQAAAGHPRLPVLPGSARVGDRL